MLCYTQLRLSVVVFRRDGGESQLQRLLARYVHRRVGLRRHRDDVPAVSGVSGRLQEDRPTGGGGGGGQRGEENSDSALRNQSVHSTSSIIISISTFYCHCKCGTTIAELASWGCSGSTFMIVYLEHSIRHDKQVIDLFSCFFYVIMAFCAATMGKVNCRKKKKKKKSIY